MAETAAVDGGDPVGQSAKKLAARGGVLKRIQVGQAVGQVFFERTACDFFCDEKTSFFEESAPLASEGDDFRGLDAGLCERFGGDAIEVCGGQASAPAEPAAQLKPQRGTMVTLQIEGFVRGLFDAESAAKGGQIGFEEGPAGVECENGVERCQAELAEAVGGGRVGPDVFSKGCKGRLVHWGFSVRNCSAAWRTCSTVMDSMQ